MKIELIFGRGARKRFKALAFASFKENFGLTRKSTEVILNHRLLDICKYVRNWIELE